MNTETETGFVVPEIVVSHFHIKDGDTVADFGAGSGYFLSALSKRTENGRVYACEIQKGLVEKISEQARRLGVTLKNQMVLKLKAMWLMWVCSPILFFKSKTENQL
jgi:precorrin-6B methylase 2